MTPSEKKIMRDNNIKARKQKLLKWKLGTKIIITHLTFKILNQGGQY